MFALAALAAIALGAWLLTLGFPGAGARRAILVSAVIAYGIQLFTFGIARLSQPANVIAGWGIGALLRFATLAVYALVITDAFELPATPALLSLAAFFFVSTLIEPVLLSR